MVHLKFNIEAKVVKFIVISLLLSSIIYDNIFAGKIKTQINLYICHSINELKIISFFIPNPHI